MEWIIRFIVALAILAIGVLKAYSFSKPAKKKSKIVTPFNVVLASVFLSAFVIFYPVYSDIFAGETFQYGKTVLLAIHNTIRLFIVDGEFGIITDHITQEAGWIYTAYTSYAAILFVLAPILTFGMVLSFFKNVSAWRRYLFGYFKNVYVFSELNEKSLTLAESIKNTDAGRLIVFTGAFESEEEVSSELLERAQDLGAICFQK